MAHRKPAQESQPVQAADDIFGPPTIRRIPSMPVQVTSYAHHMTVALEPSGLEWVFRQSLRDASGSDKPMNAFRLREAFLSIKTPEQALRFLSASGRFRFLRDKSDSVDSVLTWSEIQLWQKVVRIVLVENYLHLGMFDSPVPTPFIWGAPESERTELLPDVLRRLVWNVHQPTFDWLQGRARSLELVCVEEPKDPQHRPAMLADVSVNTSLDAILASVYIDTLSGIEYELCSLPDCPNVYQVKSNHERTYCSQACAHKASVRRLRAAKQAARDTAKASATVRKPKRERK